MAVGTVAMMVIAVGADALHRPGAGGRRAAGVPAGDRRQRGLPAAVLAALDPHPGAARRAQRDRARVLRRRDGRQDAGPRGRGDRALRRARPHELRDESIRGRPDPGRLRPAAGGAAQPRRARRPRASAWSGSSSGLADPGDVVTIAYLLTIVAFPIRSIGWLLGEFPRSVVGFDRVHGGARRHRRDGVRRPRARRAPTAGARLDVRRPRLRLRRDGPAAARRTSTSPSSPGRTVARGRRDRPAARAR